MPKGKLQQPTSALRTDVAVKSSEMPRALGSNRDALGLSSLHTPAPVHAEASHSAFDSASGKSLSPMSAGLGSLSMGAPVQAKKNGRTEAEKFNDAYASTQDPDNHILSSPIASRHRINLLKDSYNKYQHGDMDDESREALGRAIKEKIKGMGELDTQTFMEMRTMNSNRINYFHTYMNDYGASKDTLSRFSGAARDYDLFDMMEKDMAENEFYGGLNETRSENDKKSIRDANSFLAEGAYGHYDQEQERAKSKKAANKYKFRLAKFFRDAKKK